MKKVLVLVSAAVLLVFTLQITAVGKGKTANWSVAEMKCSLKSEIQSNTSTTQAGDGSTILEIAGVFTSRDPKSLTVKTGDVRLEAIATDSKSKKKSVKSWKLIGVGLTVNNETGESYYSAFDNITKGYESMSLESGDGFNIGREEENSPLTFTLLKNPCRLCLAFMIPKDAAKEFTLHFADTTTPIQLRD